MIFINVNSPVGREVFARGDYTVSFGTIPVTIATQAGTHTYDTVADNTVDFRGRVVNVPDGATVDLDLKPLAAPEPIVA